MAVAVNFSDFGFDVVDYIKKLRNVGVTQEIAEVQGQELAHVIKSMTNEVKAEIKQELHADELVTKKDLDVVKLELEVKIALIESRLLKWMLGIGVASVIAMLGGVFSMLKFMLH